MVFANPIGNDNPMSTSSPTAASRSAAVLLALEGLVLLGLAGWEIAALFRAEAGSAVSGTAMIAMTLIGAAGLGAFAWAVWTGRSWGRSGGVVAQLLVLAVAFGAVTGDYGDLATGVIIGAPGALGLILLIAASRGTSEPHEE